MFLLQQGARMLSHVEEFLINNPHSGVILSPRVVGKEQLEKHFEKYKNIPNTTLYFDPHFYEPRTDLDRILSYPYWENYEFETKEFNSKVFCEQVVQYQVDTLNLDSIILPGRYTNSYSESWLNMHFDFAKYGCNVAPEKKIFSTIALGPDMILNKEYFDLLVDEIVNYPSHGVYLVYEHPKNEFLIDQQDFLYALLDGLLSISLTGKEIIVGYANQQSLLLLACGVDFIASGNYRNVRAFDHLNSSDRGDAIRKKALWYFDGNSLGEYKLPALSLAFRRNLSSYFGPETVFSEEILKSPRPADIRWPEKSSFFHYLTLMNNYCNRFKNTAKKDRANQVLNFYEGTKEHNLFLQSNSFNFGDRGFNNVVDETIDALKTFISDRKIGIASL